jgi:hypothetical protein
MASTAPKFQINKEIYKTTLFLPGPFFIIKFLSSTFVFIKMHSAAHPY